MFQQSAWPKLPALAGVGETGPKLAALATDDARLHQTQGGMSSICRIAQDIAATRLVKLRKAAIIAVEICSTFVNEDTLMWTTGQRVFAQKGTEQPWYTGTIKHVDGERCYVIFDDGDDAFVDSAQLKLLDLHAGDLVFARLPMEADFRAAKVLAWDGDKVNVQWTNGEENWTSFGMIRLESNMNGPLSG